MPESKRNQNLPPENSRTDETIQPSAGVNRSNAPRERIALILINIVVVVLVLVAGYLIFDRFLAKPSGTTASALSEQNSPQPTAPLAQEKSTEPLPALAPLENHGYPIDGIQRVTLMDTKIPNRPRVDVITYTVKTGESLFSIADDFKIKPETLLWGNFETLQDNPHLISANQVLNILPENGTYYEWHENDNLNSIASFFGVDPQAIIDYPGNHIDLTQVNSTTFGIQPGSWLIIPGGKRAIKDWGPPAISRKNPAAARYYGAGSCGSIYEGAIGNGTFVYPTVNHSISGYTYNSAVHPGVDFGGPAGNSVFAADGGVVVYAGWSDYGYGYLIVVDHGTGWQSAYAHLSAVGVGCGQSVFQGGAIGAVGNTGNSSGAHLHFELVYNGAKVNPLDYLP